MNDNQNEVNVIIEENSMINKTPKETAETIIKILDLKKARDIKLLYVEQQTILADYFIICTGTSNTQIRALAGEVREKLEIGGVLPIHVEGENPGNWVLLDYASVIVHIFNREMRDFYKLEKLWQDVSPMGSAEREAESEAAASDESAEILTSDIETLLKED